VVTDQKPIRPAMACRQLVDPAFVTVCSTNNNLGKRTNLDLGSERHASLRVNDMPATAVCDVSISVEANPDPARIGQGQRLWNSEINR
jgi:hypothetical protein